jgi:DNA polymerase (family 10)
MSNYAIARIFNRIADLMEIKGENFYKIRAYRNAAQAMQDTTESLEVLAERGQLKTIPGVGEAIADKTREILATGTTKLYERLKEGCPEGLIELLGLPGFGPKKIQSVWHELGVRTLADLEEAVRGQRLRTVPGFSERSEENLLRSIEGFRRRRERIPLFVALPYAEGLVRMLRETGAFERLEIAGSIRRMKDMVGGVNLAASAAEPGAALEAFVRCQEAQEVLERGERSACIQTYNGTRVDLHVAPPGRFGSLLQYLTGSGAHNAALERLAREKGVGIGPEGLLDVPGADEEAVYPALGLPCLPPELREARGEMEAALEGRLPRLIEVGDIRGILHAHSTWTDGAATIEKMARAAKELGYSFHAVTDHSRALAFAGGLDPERLEAQMAEVDAVNAALGDGFRVFTGIECDILADGTLDLPVELLERLDVVIASVHSHQRQDRETITARVIRALETGVVDILAHPTGRILGGRDPSALDMERVMDAAIANGVALEMNAYPDRLDMSDELARRAKERGIPISLNTDAHRVEHLSTLRMGVAQARRAWLEPEDVINTWPLERLEGWLRDRER